MAAGWVELMDATTGRGYYINTVTGQSQWERPVAATAAATVAAPPPTGSISSIGALTQMDPASIAAWAQSWTQQRTLGALGRGLPRGAAPVQDFPSFQAPPPLQAIAAKARCRFYGPGTSNDCRRGDSCPFVHDNTPAPNSFCRFFGPGTSNDCKRGDKCPFVHDATGVQRAASSALGGGGLLGAAQAHGSRARCRFWGPGTPNDCRRGDQCPFSHNEAPALGALGVRALAGGQDRPRCRFYPGDCRRGPDCPFLHVDGEGGKQRCRFFGAGTPNDCRRGDQCPFLHESTPLAAV